MNKRLKDIEEYYTNLEYKKAKTEFIIEIDTLGDKEVKFKDANNIAERFFKALQIIEDNLSLFKSVCDHIDSVTTIIEYLHYFGIKLSIGDRYDSREDEECEKIDIILTILDKCDCFIRHFLYMNIVNDSALNKSFQWNRLEDIIMHRVLIILEDSDLYAVIRYLSRSFLPYFDKIWIQESIQQKFVWLVKHYLKSDDLIVLSILNISTFRTKKEFFTANVSNRITVISIWTEDIVFAKNLATSLNGDAVFINTNIDLYDGIMTLPYTKVLNGTLQKCTLDFDDFIKESNVQNVQNDNVSTYNLFYDGIWKPPVKGTYWIHDNCQMPNATSYDVNKCINSAEKGFEIWSSKSITSRMQILSKLAFTLKCNSKPVLADIITESVNFSFLYKNSCSYVNELEISEIRNPIGIIILKEEDEAILFRRLIQILIAGNSVIIISNTNFHNLVPYCNMFSVSEIPPGVINLLSIKNSKKLEFSLCGTNYTNYAKQFFSENNVKKTFINLTKPKQIIIPFK